MPAPYEPTPEEVAEIEARKAELRAAKGDPKPGSLRWKRFDRSGDGEAEEPSGSADGARRAIREFRRASGKAVGPVSEARPVTRASDGETAATRLTDPEAPNGRCPDCGKPYGKVRRCYVCKPSGRAGNRERSVTPATPYNGHAKDRLPSIERLDLAAPAARSGGVVSAVRAELRAMGEILSLVEKLDDAAAERTVAWVLERIRSKRGSG